MRSWSARWALSFALVLGASVAGATPLTVYFLDVGQGDAELIVSPTGKTVLIDAGPPEAAGRLARRLAELLSAPLDLVVLTHPHLDHLGGLRAALEVRGAKLFLDSGFPNASPAYEAVLESLEKHHLSVKTARAGRNIDLGGGATLQVLAPVEPFLSGTRSDINANSVVMRLTYGHRHVYFSGDSEAETESRVLASGQDLAADVYKVAHHGSKHSSGEALLRAIHPSVAVIEVGRGNDYGHPTPEALERLRAHGARVLRTDEDGEVRLVTDGDSLEVTAEHPHDAPAAGAPADRPAPTPPLASGYVASRRSRVFHTGNCPAASRIEATNRVTFASRSEAEASGRTPAKDCHP